jgi:hypothetical protein
MEPAAPPVRPSVPDTLREALDPRWLSAALGQVRDGVAITSVDPGPIISRVSTNARFHVDFEPPPPEGIPQDLCVKG